MFERVNAVEERINSWSPCAWCDAEDTCADLNCIFCDGNKDDWWQP